MNVTKAIFKYYPKMRYNITYIESHYIYIFFYILYIFIYFLYILYILYIFSDIGEFLLLQFHNLNKSIFIRIKNTKQLCQIII